jgi:hypothetical protein
MWRSNFAQYSRLLFFFLAIADLETISSRLGALLVQLLVPT